MTFYGLRSRSMSNYRSTDGLGLRNLQELRIVRGRMRFETIPTNVIVRQAQNCLR
jgi:hypothetical protein